MGPIFSCKPMKKQEVFSGLATLLGFAYLVLLGLLLNKSGKGIKYLKYKRFHSGKCNCLWNHAGDPSAVRVKK
jgi:hypothetical protein